MTKPLAGAATAPDVPIRPIPAATSAAMRIARISFLLAWLSETVIGRGRQTPSPADTGVAQRTDKTVDGS